MIKLNIRKKKNLKKHDLNVQLQPLVSKKCLKRFFSSSSSVIIGLKRPDFVYVVTNIYSALQNFKLISSLTLKIANLKCT